MRIALKAILLCFFVVLQFDLAVLPGGAPGPAPALAQGADCPAVVKAALDKARAQCLKTSQNKMCYGNVQVSAEPQAAVKDLKFAKPGDIADVKNVRALTMGALDATGKQWGIVLARIQADLPGATANDNVTLVMFGDVQVTDAVQDANTARPGQLAALLTAQPSPTVQPTPEVTPSSTPKPGPTAKPSATPRPSPTAKPGPTPGPFTYRAMQAFYFKSGSTDQLCAEAPPDGILIQTPQGKGKIELSVDGVRLLIGSTIFLQAPGGRELIISVIEGNVTAIAAAQLQTASTGQRIRIPLTAQLLPAGPPAPPDFYDNAAIAPQPISLLPQQVTILTVPLPGAPVAQWILTYDKVTLVRGTCTFDTTPTRVGLIKEPAAIAPPTPQPPATQDPADTPDPAGIWLIMDGKAPQRFRGSADGFYIALSGNQLSDTNSTYEFSYKTPTHIEGNGSLSVNKCLHQFTFHMDPAPGT